MTTLDQASDRLIELIRRPESTPGPPPGCHPLKAHNDPIPRAIPSHRRTREEVSPELRKCFSGLLAGRSPWPLYLWSAGPGTGKTSAALALLDHCRRPSSEWNCSRELRDFAHGFIDFSDAPRLYRAAAKKTYFWHRGGTGGTLNDGDLWEWIRRDTVIVLDDVRKPSDKEMNLGDDHYGILKRILDLRVNRPLVLTSNLDPYEPQGGGVSELVKVFDDRIADRIHAGTIFELAGASRRIRQAPAEA